MSADENEQTNEPKALREVLEGLSIRSQQAKDDDNPGGEKKHAFWDTQPVPSLSKLHSCPAAHIGLRANWALSSRTGLELLELHHCTQACHVLLPSPFRLDSVQVRSQHSFH